MRYFDWNILKNEKLKTERGVSFEAVVSAIIDGKIIKTLKHPNKAKYGKQMMYIVEIDDYSYLVPFIQDNEKIFLKTIIPSRKATRDYLINKRRKL